jgi:hypothetical protein
MELLTQNRPLSDNPLDLLEQLVSANDWIHDRSSESELVVQISGQWCDYHLCTIWHPEVGAMYLSCQLDVKVPSARKPAIQELVVLANERLWLGHFDFCQDDGCMMFRHTIPLRGTRGASVEQLEDLMDTALIECERIYPATQMVVWGGCEVAEAFAVAAMETVGEA